MEDQAWQGHGELLWRRTEEQGGAGVKALSVGCLPWRGLCGLFALYVGFLPYGWAICLNSGLFAL